MNYRSLSLVIISLAVLSVSCRRQNEIKYFCMAGSEELNAITDTWRSQFEGEGPLYEGRGNGTGPRALLQDACELAAMSRPMSDSEFQGILNKTGREPAVIPVAAEALVIITHKNNPRLSISADEVIQIFTEGKSNQNDEISIFGVNSASDRYRFFRENILKGKTVSDRVLEVSGPLELVDRTGTTPLSYGYARPSETADNVKILAVEVSGKKISADTFSVQNGIYPFSRYFYIYVRTDRPLSSKARNYLNFILSDKAQKALLPHGLYPVSANEKEKSLRRIEDLK